MASCALEGVLTATEASDAGNNRTFVAAARGGDEEAFGELYRRFSRAVHGIIAARLPIDDVADPVQEVFLQAWTRLRELRDDAAFPGWICIIARRRAADHYRRRHTFEPLPAGLMARAAPLPLVREPVGARALRWAARGLWPTHYARRGASAGDHGPRCARCTHSGVRNSV